MPKNRTKKKKVLCVFRLFFVLFLVLSRSAAVKSRLSGRGVAGVMDGAQHPGGFTHLSPGEGLESESEVKQQDENTCLH